MTAIQGVAPQSVNSTIKPYFGWQGLVGVALSICNASSKKEQSRFFIWEALSFPLDPIVAMMSLTGCVKSFEGTTNNLNLRARVFECWARESERCVNGWIGTRFRDWQPTYPHTHIPTYHFNCSKYKVRCLQSLATFSFKLLSIWKQLEH